MVVRKVSAAWVPKPFEKPWPKHPEELAQLCTYLQIQKYFKKPNTTQTFPFVSRALSGTHIAICTSSVHSHSITLHGMPWLEPGSSWLGSSWSLLGFTSLPAVREDGFAAESLPDGWVRVHPLWGGTLGFYAWWQCCAQQGKVLLEYYHLFLFHSLGYCQCSLLLHPQLLVFVVEEVKKGSTGSGKHGKDNNIIPRINASTSPCRLPSLLLENVTGENMNKPLH